MKNLIYILALTIGLWSCNNGTKKKSDMNINNKLKTNETDQQVSNIYIKDKSLYEQTFIDGLSKFKESIKLIDNLFITGNDTINFPEDLKLNKSVVFKSENGNNNFNLIVTRTNLTSLNYNFKLSDEDEIIYEKTGKAILGFTFFLGTETDYDNIIGDNYGSHEYWDKNIDCWFSIRIGIGTDKNGKQRAKITYGCEDKSNNTLSLQECPILRTE